MNTVVIVDYRMGNTGSVKRKLDKLGAQSIISSSPEDIMVATKIILPGIGHFQKAVQNLKELKLWDVLNHEVLINKKPVLGICLGMQLMAKHSEEGNTDGMGWFDADVVRFHVTDKLRHKIPHTGWNQIAFSKDNILNSNIPNSSEFYFVHAYYIKCNTTSDILHETEYEFKFTSAIQKDNIYGVQYHPEKSHDVGEQLLKNFIAL